MHFAEKLKEIVSGILSASLGIRILVGTILGAIGSSTVIGFIADIGAVNYALAYGARLPTEGVPYLRYATTALSLSVFAIAFGVLFLLNWIIVSTVRQFLSSSSIEKLASVGGISKLPLKTYLLRAAIPALLASGSLFQLFIFFLPTSTGPQWPIGALILMTVLVLVLARKPEWSKWVITMAFSVAIAAFLVLAFTPSLYGKALKFARQGGGVVIHITLKCDENPSCIREVSGPLFLRTTEYFLLRNEET